MFIMDQSPIFSGGVLLEISFGFFFLIFANDQNGPRGIWGFLLTGAFSPYTKFAAVDTAVIPLKLWRPLDVCKLGDVLVLGNDVGGEMLVEASDASSCAGFAFMLAKKQL